jgi:hypothetical protein
MTITERLVLEARIRELEQALAKYMCVVDLTSFTVGGDLRRDYLTAYAGALAVVPRELYKPLAPMRVGGGVRKDV